MNKKHMLWLLLLFMITGCCEVTGNPHEGGLFCWSEEKAIEYIEAKMDILENKIARIDAETKDIQQEIRNKEEDIINKQSLLAGIQKERNRIQAEISLVKDNKRISVHEKKQRIKWIDQRIEKLLKIATLL